MLAWKNVRQLCKTICTVALLSLSVSFTSTTQAPASSIPVAGSDGSLVTPNCSFITRSITRVIGPCFLDRGFMQNRETHVWDTNVAPGVPAVQPMFLGPNVNGEANLFARVVLVGSSSFYNGPGADVLLWTSDNNVRLALFPGDVPILGHFDGELTEDLPITFGQSNNIAPFWRQFSYDLSDLGVAENDFVAQLWVDTVGLPGGERAGASIWQGAALFPSASTLPPEVPLPAGIALLLTGLVGLLGVHRLRREGIA